MSNKLKHESNLILLKKNIRQQNQISITRFLLSLSIFTVLISHTYVSAESNTKTTEKIDVTQNNETKAALKNLEKKVLRKVLPNGVRVLLYNRGTAPVFAGVITVRVGGVDEQLGQTGISHMLEHMAFKGTEQIGTRDYPKEKKLLEQLEKLAKDSENGTKLNKKQKQEWAMLEKQLSKLWESPSLSELYEQRGGSNLNATTDKDLTTYFVEFPKNQFEFWAYVESERIINTIYRQFYKERDVVLEERRMRYEDDPEGRLYEKLLGTAFSSHPYRNPVIGYKEDVGSLLASEVEEFQKKYYVGSNIVIALAGSIDPEADLKIIEKYFGRIPDRSVPERTKHIEEQQEGERSLTIYDQSADQVMLAYHKPNYPDSEDPPISVLNQMIAGSRIAPVYKKLVEEQKILTSLNVFEAPGYAYPNLMIFQLVPHSEYTNEQAVAAFDQVFQKFINSEIDQKYMEIAKRAMAIEYLARLQTNLSLAKDLASAEHIYGDWKAALRWHDEVEKVTAADLQRVAKKFYNSKTRTIAYLKNKSK
jgi:predicted Zn-dependent peptidase